MLTDLNLMALHRITGDLRPEDSVEIFNQRPHDNGFLLAYEIFEHSGRQGVGQISWLDGSPMAAGGLAERWPCVWEVWMFGRPGCKPALMPLMRWLRQKIKYYCYEHGVHRLECESHQDHDEAHRFLEGMGARIECVLPMYGKDGSDFIRYVWIRREGDALLNPEIYHEHERTGGGLQGRAVNEGRGNNSRHAGAVGS